MGGAFIYRAVFFILTMAEGKKSFIAYSDWNGMFKALPDEVAGKLIKHIFSYVNDESPETEDFMIKALFEQIKATLKRDLQKWDKQRNQRSEAGKKSAEVRATKSNDRSTNVNEKERNSTVSVSVNVSDSVNVNEILLKKEPKEKSEIEKINLSPFKESFRTEWIKWIDYKRSQWKQSYKRIETQQTAFKHLLELSNNDESTAKKIIEQSIGNLWKGLISLKTTETNGKSTEQAMRDYLNS